MHRNTKRGAALRGWSRNILSDIILIFQSVSFRFLFLLSSPHIQNTFIDRPWPSIRKKRASKQECAFWEAEQCLFTFRGSYDKPKWRKST